MKTNRIIQLAAGVLLLTACTSDFYEEYVNGRVPVNLGYEVLTAEESTRTAASTTLNDATIASGDNITVKIKNNGADASAYNPYNYTAGDGGAMTPPSPKPYYPTGSTNIDILAYYPANAASNFDVAADQTTNDSYKASDLMVATVTNQAKTTSAVALAFQHKMAKLVVTATKGDGVNTIQTITLKNVKRRVTFTNTTGAVGSATAISGSTDVTLFKSGTGTSGTGAALIPGQTIEGDVLEIVTDQGTATYNVGNSGKTFNANTKYTISVTVNRTAVGATNTITWGSEASLTIHPTVEVTKNQYPLGLPGLFSVSANKQVYFSQGNLQYQASTGTWRFAENQYDYVGDASNGNVYVESVKSNNASISSSYDGWIDLFGWATSGYNSKNPYMTSTEDTDYGPSISSGEWTTNSTSWDWGVHNAISNGGNSAGLWRTLSRDEWTYVFGTNSGAKRSGATVGETSNAYYTKATINTDGTGVNGVILFPDGATFAAGEATTWGTINTASAWGTRCTTAQWTALEAKGCVFLPAAGGRYYSTMVLGVGSDGSDGVYWSSTADGTDYAYYVFFGPDDVTPANYSISRSDGFSVRLVRPVWYKVVSSATSSDIGKIICSNGHIHTNVSDVACGGSASAIIAYVGATGETGYNHGLAMALSDDSDGIVWNSNSSTDLNLSKVTDISTAKNNMSGISNTNTIISSSTNSAAYMAKNHAGQVTGCSQWFLPSSGQWIKVLGSNGLGKLSDGTFKWLDWFDTSQSSFKAINNALTATGVGGTALTNNADYWSCSEYDADFAVYVYFRDSYGVSVCNDLKSYARRVRAFLAF